MLKKLAKWMAEWKLVKITLGMLRGNKDKES